MGKLYERIKLNWILDPSIHEYSYFLVTYTYMIHLDYFKSFKKYLTISSKNFMNALKLNWILNPIIHAYIYFLVRDTYVIHLEYFKNLRSIWQQ